MLFKRAAGGVLRDSGFVQPIIRADRANTRADRSIQTLAVFADAAESNVAIMKIYKMMHVCRAVGRNEIDKIDSLCKAGLEHDPHDLFALGVLADVYWRNGQHEQALSFALRTLEIIPNDFNAVRVAVHAYRDRGDDVAAYPYAKRLCTAVPYTLEPYKEVTRLLKPFSWIPSIRRLRQKAFEKQKIEQTSRTDWVQWAQDYVAWYESQPTTEQ